MKYAGVNEELQDYMEKEVIPEYELNDLGHRFGHIDYTIRRSLKFAEGLDDVNLDMVYVVAVYHDIKHHENYLEHEKLSAEALRKNKELTRFFSAEQIETMAQAVEDHRSSGAEDPRTVYGKLVSSADRNTSVRAALERSFQYRVVHEPEMTDEERVEESRKHLLKKFGPGGYAVEKMYFEDEEYRKFLRDMTELAEDPKKFREASIKVNRLSLALGD